MTKHAQKKRTAAEKFDDPAFGLDQAPGYRPEEPRNAEELLAQSAHRGSRELEDEYDSASSGKDDRLLAENGIPRTADPE